MSTGEVVGFCAAMGSFAVFEQFARRARRAGGHDESPGPMAFRLLTIAAVVGCFLLGPSRAVAVGLTLGLLAVSQAAMWWVTVRTGNSVRGASLESLGFVSACVVGFGVRALTSPAG